MTDLIAGSVVVLILCAAILYIRKEKKNGVKCVGCPASKTCGKGHCHNSTAY